ncbi:MAG TPA: lysophospholipid acyltransferase family protein [Chitinophagaceae bacterium]|nr:lysophospholipid acyltransferase family protein [Chitinophagaceae bacterium]
MYYLVYGLLYLFSLLPLRVLFLFSDLAFFLLYYVIGYRRGVVMANLAQAFPEKSPRERQRIARRFYRNFTDNFIEFIKMISAGRRFLERHFQGDYSLPNRLYAEGRRCELLLAHNFNWEMACVATATRVNHLLLVVYMPISNRVVDRLFLKIRAKTGAILLPATNMRQAIIPYRDEKYMLVLVADQNPGIPKSAYWVNFFGRPTPFVRGPESGARRGNTPVLYCKFTKERRGYYRIFFEMGHENPGSLREGELTLHYTQYLERFIREHPDMWLWSHRRWKWSWQPDYPPVIGQEETAGSRPTR